MDKNHRRIIKTLDNMPRFFFWGMDEFILMVTPFFIGILLGSVLLMILGIVLKPFYTKLKRRYPNGFLKHKLYWNIPKSVFSKMGIFKKLPPSHYRDLVL